MILLDTCVLIWLSLNDEKLSKTARQLVELRTVDFFVSSISVFEIAVKVKKGLLQLRYKNTRRWFEAFLKTYEIQEIELNSQIIFRSTELPPIHQDPCDRLIIATAHQLDFSILTPDPLIQQYPKTNVIW